VNYVIVSIGAGAQHTLFATNAGVVANGRAVAWGSNQNGQCNVPALPGGIGSTYIQVSAGAFHEVGLRSNGSVDVWPGYYYPWLCSVPALPNGLTYVQVAAGGFHTLARRSDGSVVAWGDNGSGQCNVPMLPSGMTYVDVAGGHSHSMACRSDGAVLEWGNLYPGIVPALPAGITYVEVAAGYFYSVARRSDGSVVAWGWNNVGQCNVPVLPSGLTYVEITASASYATARRSDGSVVAWGANGLGAPNVPPLPSGLTYVEIAAGWSHTVARRSDGSVVAWGANGTGECNVPALPSGLTYRRIAAGRYHTVALVDFVPAVVSVGGGCGGAGAPVFGCNPPQIGQSVFLTLATGTPNAAGFVYGLGIPGAPSPLGSGCVAEIDPGTAISLFPVTTDGAGAWGMGLMIPPNHSLVGIQAALQAALFNTSGPLGFDLSNGLIVTIGS
jgi:hypothetical protein